MTNPTPDKNASKPAILAAAAAIVAKNGASNLTLDAVAAEANLSKGGLLYHFPNKNALLEGMLESLIETMSERSAEHQARNAGKDGLALQAHILLEQSQAAGERAQGMAILAAAAEQPELLLPAKQHLLSVAKEITAEADNQAMALVLFFATEGLRYMDMLQLMPLTTNQRKNLCRYMLELAEDESQ